MPESAGHCRWCGTPLEPTPGDRDDRLYCNASCRSAFKRTQRAATLAQLVEQLGPYVTDDGMELYRELAGHLAGKVNERI